MSVSLCLHGGAGEIRRENFSSIELENYHRSLQEMYLEGMNKLNQGEAALNVVKDVCILLEDNPLFNAGIGSVLNREGEIEMDASLMCGEQFQSRGVFGLKYTQNPIEVAWKLWQSTGPSILFAEGAEEFARLSAVKSIEQSQLQTSKRYQQWQDFKKSNKQSLDHGGSTGTVGVVARDLKGNLAAATSTGGMTGKWKGRASDSGISHIGNFACNQTLAISCTGTGDHFIQECFSYDVHAQILYGGVHFKEAIINGLEKIRKRGGQGGVIAINHKGEYFCPFNSRGMFRACGSDLKNFKVEIF